MISSLLTIAGANFILVGFKAFQQRNVTLGHYGPVLPISAFMAVSDVLIISLIAALGFTWWNVAAMALGGGFGCLLSMKLHERIFSNDKERKVQSNVGRGPCDSRPTDDLFKEIDNSEYMSDWTAGDRRIVPAKGTCLDGPERGVCLYPPADYPPSK